MLLEDLQHLAIIVDDEHVGRHRHPAVSSGSHTPNVVPRARGVLHADLSVEALDDVRTDRKTESSAFPRGLGTEERLEDPRQDRRRDARAVVTDRDLDTRPNSSRHRTGHDPHGARWSRRLERVHQEVDQDLLELITIGADRRQGVGNRYLEGHTMTPCRVFEQDEQPIDDALELRRLDVGLGAEAASPDQMTAEHDHPGRKEGEHAQPPQSRGLVSLGEIAGLAHTCLRRDRADEPRRCRQQPGRTGHELRSHARCSAEEANKGHEPSGEQRDQPEGPVGVRVA